jgi:hypothetical protein
MPPDKDPEPSSNSTPNIDKAVSVGGTIVTGTLSAFQVIAARDIVENYKTKPAQLPKITNLALKGDFDTLHDTIVNPKAVSKGIAKTGAALAKISGGVGVLVSGYNVYQSGAKEGVGGGAASRRPRPASVAPSTTCSRPYARSPARAGMSAK